MKIAAGYNFLIPEKQEGAYIVTDVEEKVLYVGCSVDLKLRLNKRRLHHDFERHNLAWVYVFYTHGGLDRYTLEKNLVNFFNPPLNINKMTNPRYFHLGGRS